MASSTTGMGSRTEEDAVHGVPKGVSYKYTMFLYRFKYVIVAFWLVAAIALAYFAVMYIPSTRMQFDPPNNSQAAQAHKVMNEYFPDVEHSGMNIVYIQLPPWMNIMDRDNLATLNNFTNALKEELKQYDFISTVIGYSNFDEKLVNKLDSSYLKYLFVSDNEQSTYIIVTADKNNPDCTTKSLERALQGAIDVARQDTFDTIAPECGIVALGNDIIMQLATDSTMQDLFVMDVTVIPVAFIIFAIFLRSGRLILIPLAILLIVLSTACGLCYFMTISMVIPPFSPSMQSAFALALTVDYCLFLLCSYRRAIQTGLPVVPAVRYMMATAGKVVVISCSSIILAVLSLVIYDVNLIRFCGATTIITLALLVLICITFLPSLLLSFPHFFSRFSFNKKTTVPLFYGESGLESPEESQISEKEEEECGEETGLIQSKKEGCYDRVAKHLSQVPRKMINTFTKEKKKSVAVVVWTLVLAAPFTYLGVTTKTTLDMNLVLPKGSETVDLMNDFTRQFSPGLAFQTYLTFTPENPEEDVDVFAEDVFNEISRLMDQIATDLAEEGLMDNMNYYSYSNIAMLKRGQDGREPMKFTWDEANECKTSESRLCQDYNLYSKAFVTEDSRATNALFVTNVGIDGKGGDKMVEIIRRDIEESMLMDLHVHGDVWGILVDLEDCITYVNEWFPIITAIIVVVVFTVMAIAYSSIFTLVRLIISIAVSVSFALGISNLIYAYILDVKTFWAVIPFAFCIMIGLSCDYDSFIYSYYRDYRNMGYTEKASIRKAVYEVSSVVQAAGIIMAVSFTGLLISHLTLLQQIGTLLFIDVLVETFWVRPFFVTSFINFSAKVIHWPFNKKLPPEQYLETREAETDFGEKFTSDGWGLRCCKK